MADKVRVVRPRPLCINLLCLWGLLANDPKEKQPKKIRKKTGRGQKVLFSSTQGPTWRRLATLSMVWGGILGVAVGWLSRSCGIADFAIRGFAIGTIVSVSGCFLALCWSHGGLAVVKLRGIYKTHKDRLGQEDYFLRRTGLRDWAMTLVLSGFFAFVFFLSGSSRESLWEGSNETIKASSTWVVLGSSFVAFLPVSSGFYWLACLYVWIRRMANRGAKLNIPPIDPLSAPGIDELWGLVTWVYWSYLLLSGIALGLWYLPNHLAKQIRTMLPGWAAGPLIWQQYEGYKHVIGIVIGALVALILVMYALSYLGMQRMAICQRYLWTVNAWNQFLSVIKLNDNDKIKGQREMVTLFRDVPLPLGVSYFIVNIMVPILVAIATVLALYKG